jgi:hypothetical protein
MHFPKYVFASATVVGAVNAQAFEAFYKTFSAANCGGSEFGFEFGLGIPSDYGWTTPPTIASSLSASFGVGLNTTLWSNVGCTGILINTINGKWTCLSTFESFESIGYSCH